MSKTRVLSGIKSSGQLTLGNYLGAMRRWAADQDQYENFYFIPDLHALNTKAMQQHPEKVRQLTYETVAWLLAAGVDPAQSTIYVQSQIHEHAELSWILENYTYIGELRRMTQFKDKQTDLTDQSVPTALFTYPVLMAADILLYDADEVPVGEDQVQHVELTRDIAERFNHLYGETFQVPQATVQSNGARIMNLQHPEQKMSKSDSDDSGNILLQDDPEAIRRKFKRAVTDSGSEIAMAADKLGISNLLTIYAVMQNVPLDQAASQFHEASYGEFKQVVGDLAVEALQPLQARFQELMADREYLETVMADGRQTAQVQAARKLSEVKQKIGLIVTD